MFLLQIESPDAFFQSEQGLVDLCSVHPRLFVLVDGISSSFTPSQIDETHLSERFQLISDLLLQLHLENGVRSGRVLISSRHSTRPLMQPTPNHLHQILHRVHADISQPDNVHLLFVVLSALHLLSLVQ